MTGSLPLRPLGRTDLKLTCLGFGTTMLGNLYRAVSEADALAATDAAYAAGIRYFDTRRITASAWRSGGSAARSGASRESRR